MIYGTVTEVLWSCASRGCHVTKNKFQFYWFVVPVRERFVLVCQDCQPLFLNYFRTVSLILY